MACPRRTVGRAVAAVILLLGVLVSVSGDPVPGTARPAFASYGISQHLGFDTCPPSISAMRAFWNHTPYWNFGLYIGGSDLACRKPSKSWVGQVRKMGYEFMPLWVGPQAPCSRFRGRFSGNPATAYKQGRHEALAAYRSAVGLGLTATVNMPIIYDLEPFNTANGGCLNATKRFVAGWVSQMHVAPAQKAGVYGSVCASGLRHYASLSPPPDFIDGAYWDRRPSTRDLAAGGCGVRAGTWAHHQRHKQFLGDRNETWNKITLNLDRDCSDGPVYPGPNHLSTAQGCV
ncbi:MAG: glycoside hydrolase domain-containing protein [Mycobacteriales bacterium]